jgi:CDP-6-deoxy-D-xylo-4-hexulose-3-dehydrase
MLREMTDENLKNEIINDNCHLNKDFIFIAPAHNFRSTEINAVLGLSQIGKLDINNKVRIKNFEHFIKNLNSDKYHTDLEIDGQCNYAFIVILKDGDFYKRDRVEKVLKENNVEFRRGLSGGGNQTLQPFIKNTYDINQEHFKNVNYIHNFSWYIGNYPTLSTDKIDRLLKILNEDI